MSRTIILAVAAAALLLGACSSSGSDDTDPAAAGASSTTAAPPDSAALPSTTVPPDTSPSGSLEVDPASFQSAGPYEVGVTTLELPTSNLVEVYYPAVDEADGQQDSYQVRSFLPDALEPVIPAETADTYTVEAGRDADESGDGPFPLVLFSHGAASFRTQSSELMRHLASWGMVVASPDHPSRDLESWLAPSPTEPQSGADDIRATRELVTSLSTAPLAGLVDASRVAVSGHSAGGGTALEVAADDGIAGYISYASGKPDNVEMPAVPSLYMAGALDAIADPEGTAAAHARAAEPSWLWVIDEAGHLAFSDLCAVGEGQGGLIGMAESAGIGDLVPDGLRRLATDGCEPPNLPVEAVWPAVNQASVAFYRLAFELEDNQVGRGLDAIDIDGVQVSIDAPAPA